MVTKRYKRKVFLLCQKWDSNPPVDKSSAFSTLQIWIITSRGRTFPIVRHGFNSHLSRFFHSFLDILVSLFVCLNSIHCKIAMQEQLPSRVFSQYLMTSQIQHLWSPTHYWYKIKYITIQQRFIHDWQV